MSHIYKQKNTLFVDPRALLKAYGLYAKKSFSQNFLVSQKAVEKIARLCVDTPGRQILEIGPGLGTLTNGLLHLGGTVIAVEKDPEMCAVLTEEFTHTNQFKLLPGDVTELDFAKCLGGLPSVIAGNLPYQITGVILRKILDARLRDVRVVIMVQLEVAERLVAQTNTKLRGILSVLTDSFYDAKIVQRLAQTAFSPPPKVKSAVVQLTPKQIPLCTDDTWKTFALLVKTAFGQRRKTIRNTLRKLPNVTAETVEQLLNQSKIQPQLRAEQLDTTAFVTLAENYTKLERTKNIALKPNLVVS